MDTGGLLLLYKQFFKQYKKYLFGLERPLRILQPFPWVKIVTILLPPSLIITLLSQNVFLKRLCNCVYTPSPPPNRVGLDGTNPLISCWRPIFIMGYSITNKNRKCIFPKYWRYLVNFAVFWGTKTAKKGKFPLVISSFFLNSILSVSLQDEVSINISHWI